MQAAQPRRPDSPQSLRKVSHRPFCLSVKGHVKMLRLVLTVTSMIFFILAQAPEPYIVITGFEVTVIFFFIVLYLLRLDRLLKWLFWPLLDIVNSLVTTIFMIIVSVLALIPETTTMTVLGGVFGLVSVVCCIADGALIYRKLLFNPSGPYQKKPTHEQKLIL
ncbi:chemokine-like factor [Dugong dugon]